jgi:beta-glucanase (GH16 family)
MGALVACVPLFVAAGALLWACSSDSSNTQTSDSGADDGATVDATSGDSSPAEGGTAEVGSADAGAHDGGDGGSAANDGATSADGGDGGWVLAWADEFNGTGAPDSSSWTFTSIGTSTSGPGWGIEYDDPSAVDVGGGYLTITATQGADGGVTSGAIDTKGKFQQTYGRFEARMKAPPGAGVWPAFWLMGDTNGTSWPTCGEIDIVEVVGSAPKNAYGTVHSGNTSDPSQNTATGGVYTSTGADLSADFHLYAVEWSTSAIDFYVDGTLYETITPSMLTSGQLWAFDHAFYVIFDLAIGGSWAGAPNAATFPAAMQVDYVRVYKKG